MISTIIASVLLFVIVKLMLVKHERHIERFRRDLDGIRQALEDTQSDIRTLDSNMFRMLKEIQELRIAIISMRMSKGSIITSSDE